MACSVLGGRNPVADHTEWVSCDAENSAQPGGPVDLALAHSRYGSTWRQTSRRGQDITVSPRCVVPSHLEDLAQETHKVPELSPYGYSC
jgi:hypothetical protein